MNQSFDHHYILSKGDEMPWLTPACVSSAEHHYILSKDDEIPSLAPASVCSVESSNCLFDLDKSGKAEPLPRLIEAQKKVSFGEVSFRCYPTILGDHPDCIGPPLSFDWEVAHEEHFDLEEYEAQRAPRRHVEELVMDWMLRKRILRCYAGVTEEEINEQSESCYRIRKHREQTNKRLASKTRMRHLLAKVSGGFLGEKHLKHSDRQVHLKRFQGAHATMGTSKC